VIQTRSERFRSRPHPLENVAIVRSRTREVRALSLVRREKRVAEAPSGNFFLRVRDVLVRARAHRRDRACATRAHRAMRVQPALLLAFAHIARTSMRIAMRVREALRARDRACEALGRHAFAKFFLQSC